MQIEPYASGARCAADDAKLMIQNVSKIYGVGSESVTALTPMDLMVKEGDFLCIVGPSGCGKTTLLNLVAGFDKPTGGRITIDGVEITKPGADAVSCFSKVPCSTG